MIDGMKKVVDTYLLTKENASFYLSPFGLLMAKIPEKDFEGRVFVSLAFPFETTEEYVCIQNEDKEELGMIAQLSLLPEEQVSFLREEIRKKYFAPKISRIIKFREDAGNTYWDCETDHGPVTFTVRDTHRSLIRIGEDRVFVVDFDGCRYEIESIAKMDRKSYSKIQLYL
jgi:hypothetical protein